MFGILNKDYNWAVSFIYWNKLFALTEKWNSKNKFTKAVLILLVDEK